MTERNNIGPVGAVLATPGTSAPVRDLALLTSARRRAEHPDLDGYWINRHRARARAERRLAYVKHIDGWDGSDGAIRTLAAPGAGSMPLTSGAVALTAQHI